MIPLWARIIAPIAIIAALWAYVDHRAFNRGYAAAEAVQAAQTRATQAKLDRTAIDLRKTAVDLENARDAARILAMENDREILADADPCKPSPAELQRAKRRWSVPN